MLLAILSETVHCGTGGAVHLADAMPELTPVQVQHAGRPALNSCNYHVNPWDLLQGSCEHVERAGLPHVERVLEEQGWASVLLDEVLLLLANLT